MESSKEAKLKSSVAVGILITIFSGAVANGLATWKEVSVHDARIKHIEKKQESYDNRMRKLEDKIDDIHWHLIGSKEKKWQK